jgi:hypothetical protein
LDLQQALPLPPPTWLTPDPEAAESERRRRPRARAEFAARLFGGDGRNAYLEARLRTGDISVSGIFLRSTFFLPVGSAVRVEFEVPGVGPVAADGVVARIQTSGPDSGMGIEFKRFAEGALEALISIFVADEVRRFVEQYCRTRRGQDDAPSPTALLHGILAWEIHRSSARSNTP